MNSAQRLSRYSSAGNSNYEDDFEGEDDLDSDLDIDAGQGEEDEVAPQDEPDGQDAGPFTDSAVGYDDNGAGYSPADDDLRSSGNQSPVAEAQDTALAPSSNRESHGASTGGEMQSLTAPRPSTPSSPPAATLPQRSSTKSAPIAESPSSPPPTLPPLPLTVSPYLARGQATQPPPPHPIPPRPSHPPPTADVASMAAAAPSVSNTPSRPVTSRGPSPSTSRQPVPPPHTAHTPAAGRPLPSAPAGQHSAAGGPEALPALTIALLQRAGQHDAEQHQQQLAAAISQSVEVLRASEQVRQLQAVVEELTAQLLASERARSTAEGALVELTNRMQEQERRLNEAWESKLLEKQREVQQLRTKVQHLESQGIKGRLAAVSSINPRGSHQGGGGSGSGSGGGAAISQDEAAALRRQLEETETLIRGYQQENETATRRIKELERSLGDAESRAAEEVLRTERAVLLARDDAGRRNAETASKLARVLALEKELAGVREEAQSREAELKSQLEKLRAEKKAAEARAGGVDIKAMADGDMLVKQLREEMESSRAATQTLIQEMQAKLAWYAENQEMLNKNDALLAEQRETIKQLQARLVAAEGNAPKGPTANRLAAAQARVRELEAQVEQLHKALRSRAPGNSLAAVVAAARPSSEESQLVTELREQVEQLEERLKAKDEDFELQLRTYQQQFERLKAQYSERASRLEAATKARGRAKELERQLEELKNSTRARIRELEAKLKAAQEHNPAIVPATPGALALTYPAAGGPPSIVQTPTKGHQQQPLGQQPPGSVSAAARRDDLVPASHLRARELELKKLQAELERRSKQVSELHLKLSEAESRNARLAADLRRSHAAGGTQSPLPSRSRHDGLAHEERPVGPSRGARQQLDPYPTATDGAGSTDGSFGSRRISVDFVERLEERCGALTVENSTLKGHLQGLSKQLEAVRRQLEESQTATAHPPSPTEPAAIAELRRKLDAAELALVTVQRSATEAVERSALATAEHQRAMLRLHDEVVYKEGLKWQDRMALLEQELRTATQRCEQLEAELAVARSRSAGSWTPEASAFAAMERRLDDMARDMAAREAKWRAVLQDTQSLHGVQVDVQRRKWESTLAAKEDEVQATRSELQSLLKEVAQVQELQTRLVAKQQRMTRADGQ